MKKTAFLATLALVCGCSTSLLPNSPSLENGQPGNITDYSPPRVIPYVVAVDAPMADLSSVMKPDDVKTAANLVADWQVRHIDEFRRSDLVNFQGFPRYSFGGWLMGTMAIGMTHWGQIEGNRAYLDFVRREAELFNWRLEARTFDADDYVIGQTYILLAKEDAQPAYLNSLVERLDFIYANWPTVNSDEFGASCEIFERSCRERWTWIDALFMGGPVWVKLARYTGDDRYLEFGDHEFWASFDTFWDPDEHLLYRDKRYINMRDMDGEKVFWSRGNGWVYAALQQIIEALPSDHVHLDRYIDRFRSMSARLVELQLDHGLWNSSLTNPNLYAAPEASGSSFFISGLAWGVKQGILEEEQYLDAVQKAWSGLVRIIYADGRLAYVQPSGSGPTVVHKESTDVYGVGAFLLAASEVYALAEKLGE